MRSRIATIPLLAAALAALPAAASAAQAPVTAGGRPAQLVARYVGSPTAFAFGPRDVFMSDGTTDPLGIGGVYVLKNSKARRLNHSPPFSTGLAWHNRTLFISAGNELLAWRGWTGKKFIRRRVIYTAQAGFTGFTGVAFGPNGRLFVGVARGGNNRGAATPYRYDLLSMTPQGNRVSIVARGIRQPGQLVFQAGSLAPWVIDSGAEHAPDLLLKVHRGQDYGFPTCNWSQPSLCQGFARPIRSFSARTDPLGLVIVGQQLYLSEFGIGAPAQVVSVPLGGGGSPRVVLNGFPPHRHVVGLGAQDGWIYVGEAAASKQRFGMVWRFRP